jgi:hypothetical protein
MALPLLIPVTLTEQTFGVEYAQLPVSDVKPPVRSHAARLLLRKRYLYFCENNLDKLKRGEPLEKLPGDFYHYASIDDVELWVICPLNHRELIRNYIAFAGGKWVAIKSGGRRCIYRDDGSSAVELDYIKGLERRTCIEHLPLMMTVMESITASRYGQTRRFYTAETGLPSLWPTCALLGNCWDIGFHSFSKTLISPEEMKEIERKKAREEALKRFSDMGIADVNLSNLTEALGDTEALDAWLVKHLGSDPPPPEV